MNSIKPLGGNIIVIDEEQQKKTTTGIYLPETRTPDQIITGTVISVSDGMLANGTVVKTELEPGDKVLYRFVAGSVIETMDDGRAQRAVKEVEILGKILE